MGERKEEITGKEEGLRRRGGSANVQGGRTKVARRKSSRERKVHGKNWAGGKVKKTRRKCNRARRKG
jgi:hypothetical protein